MRNVLNSVDPNQAPESLATMGDLVGTTIAEPRFQANLIGAFSIAALVLAAIGVFSVMAYAVSLQTREIGIRMALGAEPAQVLGMVMRESAGLTLAGLAAGLPITLLLGKVLSSMLYDVSGFDPLVFVVTPLVLAGASLFASYLPARRATRVNPLSALRQG
jgi:ABC-type antimicrobial peptide transport system permease subunit